MAKQKFRGSPFSIWKKCTDCKQLEQCRRNRQSLTTKEIVLDCEGFYYLFKKLEEFEQHPIFDGDLKKYEDTIAVYEEKHMGVPFLSPPLVVNGALAAELALKFLIFKENGEFDCIHNLQKLFEQLPICHKTALSEMIYRQAHQNEETLSMNLSNIANLFEDYRYFFGKEHIGFTNFFNDFVHIVCDYAISLKPPDDDWEEA